MRLSSRRTLSFLQFKSARSFWTKIDDISTHLRSAEYAVRGRVPTAASVIQAELNKMKSTNQPNTKYPFDSITELNIGNPQIFGQAPISFNREVVACLIYPELLNSNSISQDARNRAIQYKESIGYSIGGYSASAGYAIVREQVANFIQKRDGTKTKPQTEKILLTDGASLGIHLCFEALIKNDSDGVMIPIPQYPLYSASIALNGASQIGYYLDESKGWQITTEELQKSYDQAVQRGVKPKIMVVINPGNPTGQVLERQTIEDIIKFCYDKKISIFADEVYQTNVYAKNKKFHSFRKVREELPNPYRDIELFSFHSISKGITGECGFRGGYVEIANLDQAVFDQIFKAKTVMLCSNTVGQILTGLAVCPPSKEDNCSEQTMAKYNKECFDLFESLKRRSEIVTEFMNSIKGIKTQTIEGAMYAFPKLNLSNKFIEHAKSQGFQEADEYYCMQVLENTGLVFVPGSGFLQEPGTHHFRTTTLILPEERLLQKMRDFKAWHENYMQKF